ncbi:NADP-dependent oxidoreductase [Actinomadura violacea]|uniref:NADP-dependent oxidoreductase n=1 Tax=Actinomadura violacea TaxID=2819934 RepID=A0ABS3RLA7_9ACTN|nr:NADP-dependent oxidoreductase [Actinomadura violacea]MBO2457519.1 NADP-dependent oxidoreductase [Actinomadura violacea]
MPRAALYREYGDSGVLEITDVPMPEPGPGMVRVKVVYSSVNPVDSKFRAGTLSDGTPLAGPTITGMDVAGTVDAIGEHVTGLVVGDRVAGLAPGGAAAEYAVTYVAALVKVPDNVDLKVAATIGVGGSTAVRALGLAGVEEGQLIFVDGAAGGVGTFLTQLAVARRVRVIGTASAANQEHLASLGATPIDYAGDWETAAREAAGGRMFDAAFDLVTGGKAEALRRLVGADDKVITLLDPEVGQRGGIIVTGIEPGFENALQEVIDAVAAGKVTIPIAQTLPLSEIARAQDLSAAGHVRGKLVISIAG